MKNQNPTTQISELFKALSQPARIEILLAIGAGEACVCHLEAVLKMRQAYISQQLMALRQAGILDTRRDGRFIFYSLVNPALLNLVYQAAEALDLPAERLKLKDQEPTAAGCACPHCEPASVNELLDITLLS